MANVQEMTPVKDSMIWSLLQRSKQDQQTDGWDRKTVPQDGMANCYTADTYAGIVSGFFRELIAEGNSKPPIVVELGGGSGRFAWQFLNRLFNYHFSESDACPEFTYLLTDTNRGNIDHWSKQQRFAPLVESGILEFAQLELGDEPVFKMAGDDLTPEDMKDRPVIVIANYFFDAIPSNLLRVNDHQIEQVYLALESTNNEFLNEPITSFSSLSERFESKPIKDAPTGHKLLDEMIGEYAKKDGDFHVVVPEIGLRFVEKFLERETPVLVLADDMAYSNPDEFDLGSPFAFNDYFAHYSNFHMFAELFASYGGETQFQRHSDDDLCFGAFLKAGSGKWSALDLQETHRAAASYLREFCPKDADELCEMINESAREASVRQVMAWIRFSKFDPKVAEACLPFLFFEIEQGDDEFNAIQVYEIYMEAYRSFFPEDQPVTFDCGIAHLFIALGYNVHALQLLKQSIEEFEPSARRYFLYALGLSNLGNMEEAEKTARKSLEVDPGFGPTLRLIADKFEEKQEEASDDRPHAHMRVDFGDPKVLSKSAKIFDEAGAVLIDRTISAELVADLREAFDQSVKDWQNSRLGKPNNVGDKRFTVPIRIQPPFNDPAVYANPVLINMLTEIMGEKPMLHAFGGVVTHSGARMQHVHREHPMLFNTDAANGAVPTYAVNVLIPLMDLDEEAGGTQFWHGTHKLPESAHWKGDSEVVYTNAGSSLVLDYRTFHGGMPCHADHGRPMLYYTYCMPWFVDTLAFDSHAALGLTDTERMNIPEQHRDMFKFAKRIAA